MKRKLLFVLGILVWMSWAAAPEVSAMRPGCGDGTCQTGSCAYSPPGTSPGDGCEEDLCSCYDDCQGQDPTYASGTDNFCDSCHGEAGTPDCQGPPICTPNWGGTDTVVGYVQEDHTSWDGSGWDYWCEQGAMHNVHMHDYANCQGSSDYSYCWFESYAWMGNQFHHMSFPYQNSCCFWFGCYGYQYCPYL